MKPRVQFSAGLGHNDFPWLMITGGAGFIGSHLAEALVKKNNIIIFDNFLTGRLENIQPLLQDLESRVRLCTADDSCGVVTVVRADVADEEAVRFIFDWFEPDAVIHAAASYNDPDNPMRDVRTNVQGTEIIARVAKEFEVDPLIYFQTSLCYDCRADQPFDLQTPVRPETSYAITKTAGEFLVRQNPKGVSLRLANICGPRNFSGPIPTFFRRLMSGDPITIAPTKRDFVFIDHLVKTVLAVLEDNGQIKYQPLNVSSGSSQYIENIFVTIASAMEKNGVEIKSEVRKLEALSGDDVADLRTDPSLTCALFGVFIPQVNPQELQRTVNWYMDCWKSGNFPWPYTHLRDFAEKGQEKV